jgi:hypothetical protein
MRYKVTGTNRDTGARMTLEFESESKAAAERKATGAGMSVHRVEDVTDGHVAHALEPRQAGSRRRRHSGGRGILSKLVILIAVAAAGYYLVWPAVRPTVYRTLLR